MFDNTNVQCVDEIKNWKDSIYIAAKPLLDNGYINKKYVDKIISNTKVTGFYMILDEYLAMPHARPEDGVINTGVSFLKLSKPCMYGTEPINLIFVIAAKDSNTHIDMIKNLLKIFQDESKKDKLINTNNKEEILNILNGGN